MGHIANKIVVCIYKKIRTFNSNGFANFCCKSSCQIFYQMLHLLCFPWGIA